MASSVSPVIVPSVKPPPQFELRTWGRYARLVASDPDLCALGQRVTRTRIGSDADKALHLMLLNIERLAEVKRAEASAPNERVRRVRAALANVQERECHRLELRVREILDAVTGAAS